MTFDEYRVHEIQDQRRRDAERRRVVARARSGSGPDVRVWNIGGLVVALARRPRRFDTGCQETPIVLWV